MEYRCKKCGTNIIPNENGFDIKALENLPRFQRFKKYGFGCFVCLNCINTRGTGKLFKSLRPTYRPDHRISKTSDDDFIEFMKKFGDKVK